MFFFKRSFKLIFSIFFYGFNMFDIKNIFYGFNISEKCLLILFFFQIDTLYEIYVCEPSPYPTLD